MNILNRYAFCVVDTVKFHKHPYCSIWYGIFMMFMIFNAIEGMIEILIWGAPFQHSWDYVFLAAFILSGVWISVLHHEYQKMRNKS